MRILLASIALAACTVEPEYLQPLEAPEHPCAHVAINAWACWDYDQWELEETLEGLGCNFDGTIDFKDVCFICSVDTCTAEAVEC